MQAIIKGVPAINKAINSIATRGKKLDADIQLIGLSVLAHSAEHGDTTVCDSLIKAMPAGSRKLALVEWMLAYGCIAKLVKGNKDDAARIAGGAFFKLDRTRTLNLDGARETQWVEFKPEASVLDAFDAQAAVQSVLKRLQAATKRGLSVTHQAQALADAHALVEALTPKS